jgi:hypothetical protein
MEADQVMKSTTPGVPDVSVPITWAYNHHYGHYLNGKGAPPRPPPRAAPIPIFYPPHKLRVHV